MKKIQDARALERKSVARETVRMGVRSQRAPLGPRRSNPGRRRAMCERCGNVFRGKRWLAATQAELAFPAGVTWMVCPACRQSAAGEYYGRVLASGEKVLAHESDIRARIANVAARARFTEPQRRIVSIEHRGPAIEVLTTSQKLAHRVAAALVQTFGGKATYHWSPNDGALEARWWWGEAQRGLRR